MAIQPRINLETHPVNSNVTNRCEQSSCSRRQNMQHSSWGQPLTKVHLSAKWVHHKGISLAMKKRSQADEIIHTCVAFVFHNWSFSLIGAIYEFFYTVMKNNLNRYQRISCEPTNITSEKNAYTTGLRMIFHLVESPDGVNWMVLWTYCIFELTISFFKNVHSNIPFHTKKKKVKWKAQDEKKQKQKQDIWATSLACLGSVARCSSQLASGTVLLLHSVAYQLGPRMR